MGIVLALCGAAPVGLLISILALKKSKTAHVINRPARIGFLLNIMMLIALPRFSLYVTNLSLFDLSIGKRLTNYALPIFCIESVAVVLSIIFYKKLKLNSLEKEFAETCIWINSILLLLMLSGTFLITHALSLALGGKLKDYIMFVLFISLELLGLLFSIIAHKKSKTANIKKRSCQNQSLA